MGKFHPENSCCPNQACLGYLRAGQEKTRVKSFLPKANKLVFSFGRPLPLSPFFLPLPPPPSLLVLLPHQYGQETVSAGKKKRARKQYCLLIWYRAGRGTLDTMEVSRMKKAGWGKVGSVQVFTSLLQYLIYFILKVLV